MRTLIIAIALVIAPLPARAPCAPVVVLSGYQAAGYFAVTDPDCEHLLPASNAAVVRWKEGTPPTSGTLVAANVSHALTFTRQGDGTGNPRYWYDSQLVPIPRDAPRAAATVCAEGQCFHATYRSVGP